MPDLSAKVPMAPFWPLNKVNVTRRAGNRLHEGWLTFLVVLGGILQGIGLEVFIIPNGFLDGGVIGMGIILTKFIALPLGVFIALLNLPFVILTAKYLGKKVAFKTLVGIIALVLTTLVMHEVHYVVKHWSLALGYGGVLLGLGTGLAIRSGGALDGTEALASILSHKSRWSVDQLILGINVAIFVVAGFVMGAESALASALLFYVVVAPMIKRVVDGGNELKMAQITTTKPQEVIDAIHTQNNRRIISHKSKAIESGELTEVSTLSLVISRVEEVPLGDLILEVDEDAIIAFIDASNVRGGIYENVGGH